MKAYWYCGIEVKSVDYVYSYISDMEQLNPGTHVVVPFGYSNTERVGIVRTCAVYLEKDAPYPVERTKHILRLATKAEIAEDWMDFEYIDHCIECEEWEDVLEWADDHLDSDYWDEINKALECFELCAQKGYKSAMLMLGNIYSSGQLVEKDEQKAFDYYKMAADRGMVMAICKCGYYFYDGRHQEVDYQQSFQYFSLGVALEKDANCLYKLGDHYRYGFGVEENQTIAYLLYSRALEVCEKKKNPLIGNIRLRIGECFLHGVGVQRNVEEGHTHLSYALMDFYKRRRVELHAAEWIEKTKALIAEAQELLDAEAWQKEE